MSRNQPVEAFEDHAFYMGIVMAVKKQTERPKPAAHSTLARLFNEVTDALDRYEAIHWPMGDIPEPLEGRHGQ